MNGTDFINFAIDTLKADSRFSDIDMSESSAFYNLVLLPFAVLSKPVFDLNTNTLNGLALDTMSSTQLDNFAKLFFTNRRTQSSSTLQVSVYLSNVDTPTEPLVVTTVDEFRTSQNQVFKPIKDYLFAYGNLPIVTISGTDYRVATIITSASQDYGQIKENSIKTTTVTHPRLAYVTNGIMSSIPVSTETDAEFISSIQSAITLRNNMNFESIVTNLRNAFATIVDTYVIGYGDPEMQRDIAVAGRTWSGHFGGMGDIFVKTVLSPATYTTVATKTLDNGYTFDIQRYKGFDWEGVDTANPDPQTLHPWIPVSGNNLPETPVLLVDWNSSSLTDCSLMRNADGEVKVKIETIPDVSFGKNYRFSPYEHLRITIYPVNDHTLPNTLNATLVYNTFSDLTDIQQFIDAPDQKVVCANYLVKSFIPVEIKKLSITYDSRYTISETEWRAKLNTIINNWNQPEPIRLSTLLKDFPAPIRLDEVWYDNIAPGIPFTWDLNGQVTGTKESTELPPTYAIMRMDHIDGSYQKYISTRQINPFVKNGLSASYRTARYFINPDNIIFENGSW